MKNRLQEIMKNLEEILRQIEDNKNVLNMQSIAAAIENNNDNEWLKSVLNVQIKLLDSIETDTRKLHREMDETILDMIHNRI